MRLPAANSPIARMIATTAALNGTEALAVGPEQIEMGGEAAVVAVDVADVVGVAMGVAGGVGAVITSRSLFAPFPLLSSHLLGAYN